MARLYFGAEPMGETLEAVEPWRAGEAPNVETLDRRRSIRGADASLSPDPLPVDAAAVAGRRRRDHRQQGRGHRRRPPADVAGRTARPQRRRPRAKQEKCLAEGDLLRVARRAGARPDRGGAGDRSTARSPATIRRRVCGVVYQNAHRYLACQFTFACDRHPDVIRDQDAWERAKAVAQGTLDGKLWLPEVGKATHYHAYWVRPGWVRTMQRLHRSACTPSIARATGATAPTRRTGATPPRPRKRRGRCRTTSRYRARRRATARNA